MPDTKAKTGDTIRVTSGIIKGYMFVVVKRPSEKSLNHPPDVIWTRKIHDGGRVCNGEYIGYLTSDVKYEIVTPDNMGCVETGKQFVYNGKTYVRIPEMILRCEKWGFVVNSIRVEENECDRVPPRFIAEHLHENTIVELI